MRTNDRLQRALAHRKLGSGNALAVDEASSTLCSDAKLFAMTFAAGFLFTAIFIG